MGFDNYRIATSKLVPVITSPGQKQAEANGNFDYQIEATNSPQEYNAIGLPNGLSCNSSTGRITGKTNTSGTSQITLTAKNSAGTGSKLLLLTVASAGIEIPVITSAMSATAKAGAPFSYQIAASNAPTSYNASLPGGGLPSGLSIASDSGLISGTPAASGTYAITIAATNSGGTGEAILTLMVDEPTPSPSPSPQAGPAQGGASPGGSAPQAQKSKKGGNKGKSSSAKKSGGGSSKKASASKSSGGNKSGAKKAKKK
jgi:PKD repeat protein